jgi:hypothetical protein
MQDDALQCFTSETGRAGLGFDRQPGASVKVFKAVGRGGVAYCTVSSTVSLSISAQRNVRPGRGNARGVENERGRQRPPESTGKF